MTKDELHNTCKEQNNVPNAPRPAAVAQKTAKPKK